MLVLVFDDNLLTSASLLDQLAHAGHDAIVAATIEQARQDVPHRPHAVLINLMARTFDPPALIRQLRGDPALGAGRLIGFCGHLEQTRRAQALEAGCDHVITNAQALKQLNETLDALGAVP